MKPSNRTQKRTEPCISTPWIKVNRLRKQIPIPALAIPSIRSDQLAQVRITRRRILFWWLDSARQIPSYYRPARKPNRHTHANQHRQAAIKGKEHPNNHEHQYNQRDRHSPAGGQVPRNPKLRFLVVIKESIAPRENTQPHLLNIVVMNAHACQTTRMASSTNTPSTNIRPLTHQDVHALHTLIETCYRAYDMTFSIKDPAEHHLKDPVKHFSKHQGCIWCVDQPPSNALRASGALAVTQDQSSQLRYAEIKAVYVHPSARRQGLGRQITAHAIAHAISVNAGRIALWSDTRFTAAHALYKSMGFTREGERQCNDFNNSSEFGYVLPKHCWSKFTTKV